MSKLIGFLKSALPFDVGGAVYPILLRNELSVAHRIYTLLGQYARADNTQAGHIASVFSERHLSAILNLAISQSPYYRNVFNRATARPEDLTAFPLLSKQIIRSNFSALINPALARFKWLDFNTGGSTGEPLRFRVTRQCGLVDKVHQQHVFERIGYRRGDKIFAFDGAAIPDRKVKKNIFWHRKSYAQLPYGSLHFSSHFLNDATADHYLRCLVKARPSFLRGYPSFIAELARVAIKCGGYDFSFVKGITLTSEAVLDYQYKLIGDAFQAPVAVQYGHSEMAVFAMQSAGESEYACSPFYGYTEILDAQGRQVEVGEVGEIVATGYFNHAMPFIRYQTGDYAVFGGRRNGATIIKRLQGRDQDFVYNANNDKVSITGLIFGRHYRAFKNIKKWQIRQSAPGHATILVTPSKSFDEGDQAELVRSFWELAAIKAEIRLVADIPLTGRGKFLFVVHDGQ